MSRSAATAQEIDVSLLRTTLIFEDIFLTSCFRMLINDIIFILINMGEKSLRSPQRTWYVFRLLTIMVNQAVIAYQKDLSPRTVALGNQMPVVDPDVSWNQGRQR